MKSLKSKTRTNLYYDPQNKDEDNDNDKESTSRYNDKKLCLTIENSFPKKIGNVLLKNKSEYHPGLSEQKENKTILTKQNSELTKFIYLSIICFLSNLKHISLILYLFINLIFKILKQIYLLFYIFFIF